MYSKTYNIISRAFLIFTKKGRAIDAGSWVVSKTTFSIIMAGSSEPHSVLGISVILLKSLTICRGRWRVTCAEYSDRKTTALYCLAKSIVRISVCILTESIITAVVHYSGSYTLKYVFLLRNKCNSVPMKFLEHLYYGTSKVVQRRNCPKKVFKPCSVIQSQYSRFK